MKIEDIIKTSYMPDHTKTVINLIYTSSYASEILNTAIKPFDISMQQFNVLRILRGQKGKPANLYTIQERMINKMSNTTRLIDKLIVKKYVERTTCEKNRRKIEIFITQSGLEALKEMDEAVHASEKKIIENLTKKEIELLNNLLERLR